MSITNIEIVEVAYHRNGVCGVGFHVVRFDADMNGTRHRMLATRFDPESDINPRIAVLDIDILQQKGVGFITNSWRGDYFASIVEDAIKD